MSSWITPHAHRLVAARDVANPIAKRPLLAPVEGRRQMLWVRAACVIVRLPDVARQAIPGRIQLAD